MPTAIKRIDRELSIADARAQLTQLPEQLEAQPGVVFITRHGAPVLVVMTLDEYEGINETMEILKDPEALADFRQAVLDIQEGRERPWNEVRSDLS